MWFSYRSGTGQKYRMDYAHSEDGHNWKLALHSVGIGVSDSGWDSEIIDTLLYLITGGSVICFIMVADMTKRALGWLFGDGSNMFSKVSVQLEFQSSCYEKHTFGPLPAVLKTKS